MNKQQNKIIRRLSLVFSNSLSSMAVPAVNLVFSLLVVRILGAEKWGEFVYYFLWASLASFVINWGNRDYLLREFAGQPLRIPHLWRESFFTRALLLVPCFAVFAVSFSVPETLLLVQWTVLLFVSQSFDVLTAYHRKFLQSFLIEIIAGLFLAVTVFVKVSFGLFTVYLIYLCIRTLLYLVLFKQDVFREFNIKIKLTLLKNSVVFFLLAMSGLIGSRADQYAVSVLLSKEELGKYQVLKSFLLYFQAAAGFIILPFVKNIYRLKDNSIDKIRNNLFLAGIILCIPFIFIIYFIITDIYKFSFSFETYLYSALFVLPAFYYLAVIYKFFKGKKEKVIIIFNLTGTIILLTLSIILIPKFRINGALIAGTVSGWSVAILFYIYNRKYFGK